MLLLPGKHEIVVRPAWYQDYVEQALLEPGEIHTIKLAMAKESHVATADRKSTRLNSSHQIISYAVFCLKKKKKKNTQKTQNIKKTNTKAQVKTKSKTSEISQQ